MQVLVKCVRSAGNSEAPDITNNLITSDSMAKARGKRFLDDPNQGKYYLTKRRTIRVPHKGEITPGNWVTVTSKHLNLSNVLLKVVNYSFTITHEGVWGVIDTEQYVEV